MSSTEQQQEFQPARPASVETSPESTQEKTTTTMQARKEKISIYRVPRECPGCGALSYNSADDRSHLRRCYPKARLCRHEGCLFACRTQQHLNHHVKTAHVEVKVIRCPTPGCDYACNVPEMLKSHVRSHDGVTRYRCAGCKLATKHPSALRKHLDSTGHAAAPVLDKDGNLPESEAERDFANHLRRKRKMVVVSPPAGAGRPQRCSSSDSVEESKPKRLRRRVALDRERDSSLGEAKSGPPVEAEQRSDSGAGTETVGGAEPTNSGGSDRAANAEATDRGEIEVASIVVKVEPSAYPTESELETLDVDLKLQLSELGMSPGASLGESSESDAPSVVVKMESSSSSLSEVESSADGGQKFVSKVSIMLK